MDETGIISFGPFTLDRRREALTRDGMSLPLGHRGFVLLEALLEAEGGTVSKTDLMERAWPGTVVEDGNLTVQIAGLRKALGGETESIIVTVPRVGYRLVMPAVHEPAEQGGSRPLIAVLPFANLSSDPDQTFFADGVVEDIITALSRFKQFAVVARNSSFVYKDRPVDIRVAARELGVRYVLEGSVRRARDRVRVTAQLIDADSGAHIWAEKFDGKLADIFDVQDAITESVVGHIEPQIRKSEIERTRRKRPENLDAYELFLRAGPMVLGTDKDAYSEAIDLLHRAIALDPGYAPAYALCGWAHEKRHTFIAEAAPPGVDDLKIAIAMSERALELDRDDAGVLAMAAWNIILIKRDTERGLSLAARAVEINPNHLLVLNFAALCFGTIKEVDRARECNMRALRLAPGAPDAYWSYTNLANFALFDGKYEEAIEWALKAVAVNGGWEVTWGALAAAYAYLDRMDEAREAVAHMRAIRPNATVESVDPAGVSTHIHRDALVAGLRKAGLPG